MATTLKTYPLDLTGTKATNKITGEVKTISKDADRVFIPTGGPFYTKSLKVWSGTTLLKPTVDYVALELNRDGTVDSGREVCNVLFIKNTAMSFKLDYQVIGGAYADLTTELIELINATPIDKLNVLTWGAILNKPTTFPPTAHTHYPYEWRGYTQVIHLLEQLRQVVVAGDQTQIAGVYQYIENNIKDIAMDYINRNGLLFIDKTPTLNGSVLLEGLGTSASPLKINLNGLFDELDARYFQNSINPLSRVGAISDSFLPISAGFFNCACPLITAVGMSVVGNVERNGDLLLLTPATNGEIVRYVYGYVRGWSSDPNIQRYRPTNQQYRPPGLAENEEIMDLCGYHEQSMIGAIFTINADGTSKYKEHCIIWLNGTFAAESHVLVRVGSNITKAISGSTVANLYAHSPKVVKLRRGEIYLLSHSNALDVDVHSFNPVNNVFTQVTGWTGILQKNVIKADEPADVDIIQSTTESTFATGQTALRPLVFWPEQATMDTNGEPVEFVVYDINVLNPEAITSHNRANPGTDRSRMQVRVVGDKVLLYTVSSWQNSVFDPVYRGGNVTYAGYSLEVTPLDMKYRWVRHFRENDAHGGAGTTAERGKLDVYATSSWSATPYDLYSYRGWWENLQPHTLVALNDGRVLNWAHPTAYGLDIFLQSYQYTKNLSDTPDVDRMFNLYFNTKYAAQANYGNGRSRTIYGNVVNFPSPTVNNVNSTAIVLADDTVILQESIANPRSGNWSKVRHTAYRPSKTIVDYPTATHGALKGYDTSSDRIELLSETGEATFDIIPWVSVRLANGTRKVGSMVWYRPLNGVWADQTVPANVKIDWDNKKLIKSEFHTMNLQTFNAIEDFVKSNLSSGGTLLHHTWTLIASPEVPTQGLLCYYGGRQDRKIIDRVVQVKLAYSASKVISSINFGMAMLVELSRDSVPNAILEPRGAFPRLQWVIEYNADKSESFWAGKLPNATSHAGDTMPRPNVYSFKCTKDLGGNDLFTSLTYHGGGQYQTSAYKSLVATNAGVGFMQDTIGYGVFRGLFRYKSLAWTEGSMFVDEDPFIWVTPRPPSDFSITVTDTIDVQIGGVYGRIEPSTYSLTDPAVSDVIDPKDKVIFIYVTLELGEPKLNFREVAIAESIYTTYIGKVVTDAYGIMEIDIQPVTRIGNYRPSATPRGASFSVSSGTADTERLLNWDAHIFNKMGVGGGSGDANIPENPEPALHIKFTASTQSSGSQVQEPYVTPLTVVDNFDIFWFNIRKINLGNNSPFIPQFNGLPDGILETGGLSGNTWTEFKSVNWGNSPAEGTLTYTGRIRIKPTAIITEPITFTLNITNAGVTSNTVTLTINPPASAAPRVALKFTENQQNVNSPIESPDIPSLTSVDPDTTFWMNVRLFNLPDNVPIPVNFTGLTPGLLQYRLNGGSDQWAELLDLDWAAGVKPVGVTAYTYSLQLRFNPTAISDGATILAKAAVNGAVSNSVQLIVEGTQRISAGWYDAPMVGEYIGEFPPLITGHIGYDPFYLGIAYKRVPVGATAQIEFSSEVFVASGCQIQRWNGSAWVDIELVLVDDEYKETFTIPTTHTEFSVQEVYNLNVQFRLKPGSTFAGFDHIRCKLTIAHQSTTTVSLALRSQA